MNQQTVQRKRVLLAFFFFPHYRGPILRELLDSPRHDYLLSGDVRDVVDGSKAVWSVPESAEFVRTRWLRLIGKFGWLRGSLRLALRRDIDVIIYHANPALLSAWIGGLVARLTGKRVLFYTIGWFHHDSFFSRLLKKIFYNIPHGLLLYGHWAKMIGIEQGFAADRLYVVYNSMDYELQKTTRQGITDDRLRAVRAELFDDPHRPMVICTSRLTSFRRLDQLVQALAILQRDGLNVNLLLVGDGPERESLQRMAEQEGVAVHFFGACYDESRLSELIAAANATIAPGMVGLTAMHSLAYGTPVITHNDPMHQAPEWEILIDGRNAGFFKRGDVADLARVIKAWTTTELTSPATRAACDELLERIYNPRFERRAFDWAADGRPAHDFFWWWDDRNGARPGGEEA